MSRRSTSRLHPQSPWYQNFSILLTWLWAGVNTLVLFFSNLSGLDILSKWVSWPVTIIGSLLVMGFLFGGQVYLKARHLRWRNLETSKNKYIQSFDTRTMVMGVGVLIALWIPRLGEWYVPPKTGNIRIAVADFVATDRALPPSTGQAIAQIVHDTLDESIQHVRDEYGNLKIEVLPPSRVPNINGSTPAEIEASVEAISRKLDADIVLYGIVTKGTSEDSANVEPFFFLAENSTFGFPEFVGQDSWGSTFEYPFGNGIDETLKRDDLLQAFSARTTALAYSIYGAWKYSIGDYVNSYNLLQKAVETTTLQDTKGLSVWYLWWGNAALKLEQFDNARTYYQNALSYRPGYARAYIGLAETTISQANALLATVGLENANEFLDFATTMLQDAASASDRPKSADIDTKVEFGLGRIAQTQYYTQLNQNPELLLEDAAKHYTKVTTEYKQGNRRISEQAGLSFMHLGEIAIEESNYKIAYENFTRALEVLRDRRAIEWTISQLASLPVLPPQQAQAQLLTAIAISTSAENKEKYEQRIKCWDTLSTPIPADNLVCTK